MLSMMVRAYKQTLCGLNILKQLRTNLGPLDCLRHVRKRHKFPPKLKAAVSLVAMSGDIAEQSCEMKWEISLKWRRAKKDRAE